MRVTSVILRLIVNNMECKESSILHRQSMSQNYVRRLVLLIRKITDLIRYLHRPAFRLCKPGYWLSIFVLGLSVQANAQLYRYINDKGVPVIDDNVPPEFVSKGYDILRNDGTLIRRVERQLTDEELKLRNTEESRARLRQEEEERLQAWDESLMRRYSTIQDIEAAQARAMKDLQIRISILKSNLNTTKLQIEREQKKAADIERRGGKVPKAIIKNIGILRLEIEDTEQSIVMRNEEIETTKAAFERDIDRFKILLDRVNLRRKQPLSITQD